MLTICFIFPGKYLGYMYFLAHLKCIMNTLHLFLQIFFWTFRFEKVFGTNRSIPTANASRWNSTYHQLSSILSLDFKNPIEICGDDFKATLSNPREWGQITELCAVLAPFTEATTLTQGMISVYQTIVK